MITVNMRFMGNAVGHLPLVLSDDETGIESISTDGKRIVYDSRYVLGAFRKQSELPARMVLHLVMHCVLRHFMTTPAMNMDYWNLACDIAVENCINELKIPCVTVSGEDRQNAETDALKEDIKPFTAEKIYQYFLENPLPESDYNRLYRLFSRDEHSMWYSPTNDGGNGDGEGKNDGDSNSDGQFLIMNGADSGEDERLVELWKQIGEQLQLDLETFSSMYGNGAGNLTQELKTLNRERYDYTDFLRRFTVMGEAMQINNDEFDYIFYTYGLNEYENVPLIEPLEYKDVKRIKDFVIAVDTSGSCSGEVVQKFITKTFNIMKQEENFFTKINIHIVQCDAAIQEDTKITSQEEFDDYIKNMRLHGFGGTDFRPVFSYVESLIEIGEFDNLKGMIYFTDGYGTFPSRKPSFETAFVFVDDAYNNPEVPVWAIKLVLQSDDI